MRLLPIAIVLSLLAGCETTPPSGGSGSSGSGLPTPSGGSPIPGGAPGTPGTPGAPSPGVPGSEPGGDSEGSDTGNGGIGSDETLEDLDTTFDESLDDFDDTIRGEEIGEENNPEDIDILDPTGNTPEGSLEDIYSEESTAADSDQDGSPGGGGGASSPSQQKGGPASDSGETSPKQQEPIKTPPLPPDVGDGRGDDIVARQMREAAIKETDPELREKLWEEYRKYRDGGS